MFETCEEYSRALINETMQNVRGWDEIRTEVLMQRLGLNGQEALTLEEVSELIDVTRERIRQIQESFEKRTQTQSMFWGSTFLDRVLYSLETCEDERDLVEMIKASQYFENKHWTLEKLKNLALWSQRRDLVLKIDELIVNLKKNKFEEAEVKKIVRKTVLTSRSKYGFLDTSVLFESLSQFGIKTTERLRDTLTSEYPRVGIEGSLVFIPATEENRAISCYLNQLALSPAGELTIEELWTGLKRDASGRSYPVPPSAHEVSVCIDQVCPEVTMKSGGMKIGTDAAKNLLNRMNQDNETIIGRCFNFLSKAENRCKHRYQMVEWALLDRSKPSTILHFLTHDGRIREEQSCFYIVGNSPDESELNFINSTINVQYDEKTIVSESIQELEVNVVIDPRWILSGRVYLGQIFGNLVKSDVSLVCRGFDGVCDENIGLAKTTTNRYSSILTIPSKCINHLIERHGAAMRGSLRIKMESGDVWLH